MALLEVLLGFLISLVVSGLIIYIATKLFGEKEGFGTALLTAFIGAIIFALASYMISSAWIASIVAGIAWIIAIGSLYNIGWLKSFIIAIVIWVLARIIGVILPTISGPL